MKTLPRCVVLFAVMLGGCLSRPDLVRESFAFEMPPVSMPPTSENRSASGPTVGVRRISVASPFDSQELTYRTGVFSFERDPYAQFLASPDQILVAPVCQYLRKSGIFSGVAEPDSVVAAEVELEIAVLQLYGDFQDRAHPMAVLQMRFLAYKNGSASTNVLLQKEYIRNIPLQARTAAAVMAGWNEALKQIVTEAAGDVGTIAK